MTCGEKLKEKNCATTGTGEPDPRGPDSSSRSYKCGGQANTLTPSMEHQRAYPGDAQLMQ